VFEVDEAGHVVLVYKFGALTGSVLVNTPDDAV
jgi:hypothetical protein